MKTHLAIIYLGLLCPIAAQQPAARAISLAMGFEDPAAWVTAPFEFIDGPKSDFKNLATEKKSFDWVVPAQNPDDLIHGVKLSNLVVKEGAYSLEWRDLPKFPTISCRTIEHDWIKYAALSISIGSKFATGDTIVIGVLSDSPETPYLDYLTYEFVIDWRAWKELRIPFADFTGKIGSPVGWGKIDAICFFAKSNGQCPDPTTTLYLDALKFAPQGSSVPKSGAGSIGTPRSASKNPNHELPEIRLPLKGGESQVQTSYFNGARGRYGYHPKYEPGHVSFDTNGKPLLRGEAAVNTLAGGGKWERIDLSKTMRDYARESGWDGIRFEMPEEPAIRSDADGDLYALEFVSQLDKAGKLQAKWSLLLHSKDKGKNWRIYPLPANKSADFEKLDGHNGDCLKYPPVITVKDFLFLPNRDASGYLIVPEKQGDGSLRLPPMVSIGPGVVMGPVHSGGGNFVISQGDKIFVVFGVSYGKKTPPIPPDHPARSMTSAFRPGVAPSVKGSPVSGGVPTFIVAYDRKTRKPGEPVFLGYGGIAMDGHNWPAITADSKGILHVVIGGHVDPIMYLHTLRPGDISAWSSPVFIPFRTGEKTVSLATYASLNCDKHDNLLCVIRSDSYYYDHRLASIQKPAGRPWGNERAILVPFQAGYHLWNHKVTYDTHRDRYFLSYYDQCERMEMSRDAYQFYRFIWPSREKNVAGNGKLAAIPNEGKRGQFLPGPQEMTVLVSDNGGASWQFATTPDFMKQS